MSDGVEELRLGHELVVLTKIARQEFRRGYLSGADLIRCPGHLGLHSLNVLLLDLFGR